MKETKLATSKKKIIKGKEHQKQSAYDVIYRKELSPFGRVLAATVYIVFIVIITTKYVSSPKDEHLSQSLSTIEQNQQEALKIFRQKNLSTLPSRTPSRFMKKEFDTMINHLDSIMAKESSSQEIIREQKREIAALKVKIEELLTINLNQTSASKEKTLNYNSENLNNLLYRHKLKLKKVRSTHKKKQQVFTEHLDLADAEVRKKYDEMVDKHKIELNERKNKLYEQRRQFKVNKYIKVATH
jgi:hypothetical protein